MLLDEPSAPLDENSERVLVQELDAWLGRWTLVVTTNRAGLLALVNRVVVIDNGQVVLDGPKDKVLAALTKPQPVKVAASG